MPPTDPQDLTNLAPEFLPETPVLPVACTDERLKEFLMNARQFNFKRQDQVLRQYIAALDNAIDNPEKIPDLKKELLRLVAERAECAWQGTKEPETVRAYLASVKLFTQIAGMLVSKSVNVQVTTSDPLFLKFKEAISGLNDDQIAEGLRFFKSMTREIKTVRDASWFPAPELPIVDAEIVE